jgi:hypothetical protein
MNEEEKKRERTSGMHVDAEREGGICTSAGVKGAEVELGGGSLATLVSDGAMIGDKDGVVCADCGAGAVEERVGPGPGPGPGPEPELGKEVVDAAAEVTAPVSRETSLSETALPVKNSPAVREGSIEGAGGKMSDWNESDFWFGEAVSIVLFRLCDVKRRRAYLARDDERDWFDGVCRQLVCSCDFTF